MAIATDEMTLPSAADAPAADAPVATTPTGPPPTRSDGGATDFVESGSRWRIAAAVAASSLAAAVMVGGVFQGASGRIDAGVAAVAGVVLATLSSRIRRPALANLAIVAGIAAIGAALVAITGVQHLSELDRLVSQARTAGSLARPPVAFTPGWVALVGWIMAMLAVTATWVAIVMDRPGVGLLIPLPVAAVAGISIPHHQQVASGIAAVALFAVGLGLLSAEPASADEDRRRSRAHELRRAVRSVPMILVIAGVLIGLSSAHILFPRPFVDPTQQPQAPKTVPLAQVQDRVLFQVQSTIKGPWRIGSLDVYDGQEWELPPYSQNQLASVPSSGIVDRTLSPGVAATFTIFGLSGDVLPGLPNTYGVQTTGPALSYDARSGSIQESNGQLQRGLVYTVVAARLPSAADLIQDHQALPPDVAQFTRIPPPPPGVQNLIDQAPRTSAWAEFDYLRTWILDNVVAVGPGVPVSVTPARVDEMITGKRQGSPFEIVAAQAMLARWIGVPSRIGYGYEGGTDVGTGTLAVRPADGATFVEVYFPGYKWLPIVGTPKEAQASTSSSTQQRTDSSVTPSGNISAQLYLPEVVAPPSVLTQQVRNVVLLVIVVLLVLLAGYVIWPALRKVVIRARRRAAAHAAGPRGRIALAYAELRDLCTDFGFYHPTDSPLLFVERFVDDDEHAQFAWLVTRCLWGDLYDGVDDHLAANAEELSRALRRRMALAQPASLRLVAVFSRLSLRHPYAPEIDEARHTRGEARELVAASR